MATVGIKTYSSIDDLPVVVPVFPLSGALLLPRTQLPLNIFEPRYLEMFDDVMAGERIIGMIQPLDPSSVGSKPALHKVGCLGRVTSFQETSDGRYMVNLGGVCRFSVEAELSTTTPYRQCRIATAGFIADLTPAVGEAEVSREALLATLKRYLQANNMEADWDGIANASTELLVNALSAMCPFGAREKQALLEAVLLKDRANTLIALTEFSLAGDDSAHHIQ